MSAQRTIPGLVTLEGKKIAAVKVEYYEGLFNPEATEVCYYGCREYGKVVELIEGAETFEETEDLSAKEYRKLFDYTGGTTKSGINF